MMWEQKSCLWLMNLVFLVAPCKTTSSEPPCRGRGGKHDVLIPHEEEKLVVYIKKTATLGYFVILLQLCLKVVEMTKKKDNVMVQGREGGGGGRCLGGVGWSCLKIL